VGAGEEIRREGGRGLAAITMNFRARVFEI
jgi:hypothetical protein